MFILRKYHPELINKMKGHDWYYEWADDQKSYLKGLSEKQEIFNLFRKVPGKQIERIILENVPKDLQQQFQHSLFLYFDFLIKLESLEKREKK
jgi:hypothetical protein